MQFLRSFFRRITNDLKIKKLIPLKILFCVHASTLLVLYPYLTIHMRELGISVEETAIMSSVTPVVSIVMPPLAGMLADKIGNFRLVLSLSSVLGGASALLLLLVPVGRITVTFPPDSEFLTSCSSNSALHLTSIEDFPCAPAHPYAFDVNISVQSCGFVCNLPEGLSDDDELAISRTRYYAVSLHSPVAKESAVYRYTIAASTHTAENKRDQSTSRIMTNDINYKSAVRRVSDSQLFFPTTELYQMDCIFNDTRNATCNFEKEGSILDIDIPVIEEIRFRTRISHDVNLKNADVKTYRVNAIYKHENGTKQDIDYGGVDNVICRDGFAQISDGRDHEERMQQGKGELVSVWAGGRRLAGCSAGCVATAPRRSLCDNRSQLIDIDPSLTFWTYLAVRVFIGIISGTSFAMFEGAVIAILRDQQADYGLQRIYGSIGGIISSPLSGMLIDYASRGKGYTDFRPAFYLYAALKIMSGALMLGINLEFKQPAQNLLEDVISVFRNVEIVALFIASFIMGTAWGYIESFLFWLLQDLGASRSLMGVTVTVGGIAGLPLLVMSGPIIRRLGHANVLFIGFIFYAIRLLGYSLIYNPWLCLVFEALESVTSSLATTAAVTYAARLSSSTTDTSVQGLLGGVYYGVGKGSGSLIGGYLMKYVGTRPTYQIFSAATLFTGCIYFLFNNFYLRKRPQRGSDIYKKKLKPTDVESKDTTGNEKELNTNVSLFKEDASSKTYANDEKIYDADSNQRDADANKKSNDNTDGSSDSGVDNQAYSETEVPPCENNDSNQNNNRK